MQRLLNRAAIQREWTGASRIQCADADGKEAGPAADGGIDALDLAPKAKAAAQQLKKKHPDIAFTSGRRDVAEQAHAMASNIVSSKNRKWIEDTYASAASLQKWVDDHPDAKTVDDITNGLEDTMNAMSESDRGKVSKHLSGEAFDVQPQEKDADAIKADIRALPDISKFLEKEGGLVRWHAQFKRTTDILPTYNRYERQAGEVAIQRARGEGQTLDSAVRARMERALGADFGGVRVHADAEADRLNRAVRAMAFTTGSDIFFREGAYQPASRSGRQLLAHELTHVVQQADGRVRTKLILSDPGDELEREADRVAAAVGQARAPSGFGRQCPYGETRSECWATVPLPPAVTTGQEG